MDLTSVGKVLVKCDRLPAFKLLKHIQVQRLTCHPIDCFFSRAGRIKLSIITLALMLRKLFDVTTF